MGKLLDDMNKVLVHLNNEAKSSVEYISKFNSLYNEFDILKKNKDIVYLKKLMKDKIILGLTNSDNIGENNNYKKLLESLEENDN